MRKIDDARKGAAAGHAKAQLDLGWLLVDAREYYEAYKWMILALDAGIEQAIEATEMLEASERVSDRQIAQAYYDVACWCEAGSVVPLNIPAAVRLWEVAEALGHLEAAHRLARWR